MRIRLQLLAQALGACLFIAVVAHAGDTAVVALDGLSAEVAGTFDRAKAENSDKAVITSILDGAVVPKNHLYPLIEWKGPEAYDGAYLLELRSPARSLQVLLKGRRWQPAEGEFAGFLADKELSVSLYWLADGRTLRAAPVRLVVADLPMTQRVAFRTIQPVFQPNKPNALRLFVMERRDQDPVMELEGTCVGCHRYSKEFALFSVKKQDVRHLVKMTPGADAPKLSSKNIGEFSYLSVSPKGRYAVVVQATVAEVNLANDVRLPFTYLFRTADVICYDAETDTMVPLPGASDPNYLEEMPEIGPDGQTVLFSKYRLVEENGTRTIPAIDLYEVPLNDCKGGEPRRVAGGPAEPYNYFGHFVPNGKWLSTTRGDAHKGTFFLTDSDIYLLNRDGSTLRKLSLNRDGVMDSWHDWSADSHWLVFSSKRDDNQMTALYLSYVDDDGKDYPPVKLWGSDVWKVNQPVFVPDGLAFEDAVRLRGYVYSVFASPSTPAPVIPPVPAQPPAPAPAAPAPAAPAK